MMQPEQLLPDATRTRAPHFVPGSQTPVTVSTEIAHEIHHALIPGELAWYTVEGAHGAIEMQLDCRDVEQMRYGDALALLLKMIRELEQAGARLIVAEYPDSEELVTYARLLREAGFEIEATVSDAIADGVGLHFAVKRLRAVSGFRLPVSGNSTLQEMQLPVTSNRQPATDHRQTSSPSA
jgi:hypothetical protein